MLNERIEAVRPIAKKLSAVEKSLNQSIMLLGELISAIPAARQKADRHVSLTVGVSACESLALAVSSAAKGYREVIEAHEHFSQDRSDLGLRTVGFGDVFECPDASLSNDPQLRIVQAA
jgi:hypothetical protein